MVELRSPASSSPPESGQPPKRLVDSEGNGQTQSQRGTGPIRSVRVDGPIGPPEVLQAGQESNQRPASVRLRKGTIRVTRRGPRSAGRRRGAGRSETSKMRTRGRLRSSAAWPSWTRARSRRFPGKSLERGCTGAEWLRPPSGSTLPLRRRPNRPMTGTPREAPPRRTASARSCLTPTLRSTYRAIQAAGRCLG
jgi:hypothetical protein